MHRMIHSALLAAGMTIVGAVCNPAFGQGTAAGDSPPTNSAAQSLSSGR